MLIFKMTKVNKFIFLVIIFSTLFNFKITNALTCASQPFWPNEHNYNAIFLGRAVKNYDSQLLTEFKILRSYKGDLAGDVNVKTSAFGISDKTRYSEGQLSLVYARLNYNTGELTVYDCDRLVGNGRKMWRDLVFLEFSKNIILLSGIISGIIILLKIYKKLRIRYLVTFLIIEIIFLATFLFLGNSCGSLCNPRNLLNPFGWGFKGVLCPAVCVYNPHPYFFITADTLIFTLVVFVIYRARKNNLSSN